jgi:hypothetical protein
MQYVISRVTKHKKQHLKETLNEICIYNTRGPHKGRYELKPQYKASQRVVDQTAAMEGKKEQ